jgi:phage tail-like protein
MARSRYDDFLQGYNFWVFDLTPSPKPPFVVLNPVIGAGLSAGLVGGFTGVSLPELTATTNTYTPLNEPIGYTYVTGYEVGSVTLRRGASRYDSSFYSWITRAMKGTDRPHRDLMILHLSSAALVQPSGNEKFTPNSAGAGYVEVIKAFGKAYILYDCIPTRYSMGGELDASSAEITITELEVTPSYFVEYSLDPSVL